jgi:hypothetical protein
LADVEVQLYWSRDDGPFQLVDTTTLSRLATNDDPVVVTFSTAGWAGMNTYRVAVLPTNGSADRNQSNNSGRTHLFVQGLPDVTIHSLAADATAPLQAGPLDLTFELRNDGIDDADHIRIEVFGMSAQLGRRIVGRTQIDHLGPLASTMVTIPIDTSHLAGDVTLIVQVDRLEKILELSDLNNTAHLGLKFTPTLNVDTLSLLIQRSQYDATYDFDDDDDLDHDDLSNFVTQALNSTFGDANLNGIFNSSDLVQVFQFGEYEDGLPGNSTWAEGDWNADGDFDSGDLVKAFQTGDYSPTVVGMPVGSLLLGWAKIVAPALDAARPAALVADGIFARYEATPADANRARMATWNADPKRRRWTDSRQVDRLFDEMERRGTKGLGGVRGDQWL